MNEGIESGMGTEVKPRVRRVVGAAGVRLGEGVGVERRLGWRGIGMGRFLSNPEHVSPCHEHYR
jgi:hypothetical protein